MATHRAQGQRVVFVDGDAIVAAEGSFEKRVPLAGIPDPQRHHRLPGRERDGLGRRGLGLGLDWEQITGGLASFVNDAHRAGPLQRVRLQGRHPDRRLRPQPGRHPGPGAGRRSMPAKRRSVVISGAGDRRDEDIRADRILGEAFDDVVLYQDACQRGRADGEVLALLRQGLEGPPHQRHQEIHGEFVAIDTALARCSRATCA
jgi:cyanophycin synthetase